MKKQSIIFVLVILLLMVWLIYFCMNYVHVEVDEPSTKTDTAVYIDTIPYYKPVAKDSTIVRYVIVKVPVAVKNDSVPLNDTVEVELPVTQKEYKDSNYHAWVSGYLPRLDSIKVYSRNVVVTQTKTLTQYKTKHWGVGVQVGYGYHFNQFSPYIGVGVQYNILNW